MFEWRQKAYPRADDDRSNYHSLLGAFRMLAALVVLVHHISVEFSLDFNEGAVAWVHAALLSVGSFNYEAVLFFFLLSGFVVSNSALRQQDAFSIKKYMKRRAGRILPIYWLSLLVTGVVAFVLGDVLDFLGLMGNVLFLQTPAYTMGWFEPWMGNGPLWSLSYEVFYYVLFGLVYGKVLGSRLGVGGFFGSMLLVWVVSCIAKVTGCFFIPYFEFGLLLPLWLLGSSLAFVVHGVLPRALVSAMVGVFGLIGLIGFFFESSLAYSYLIGALFYFVFDLCVRRDVYLIAALNRSSMITYIDKLGGGSYALYALHLPILLALQGAGFDLLPCCVVMLLLVMVCPQLERTLNLRV